MGVQNCKSSVSESSAIPYLLNQCLGKPIRIKEQRKQKKKRKKDRINRTCWKQHFVWPVLDPNLSAEDTMRVKDTS